MRETIKSREVKAAGRERTLALAKGPGGAGRLAGAPCDVRCAKPRCFAGADADAEKLLQPKMPQCGFSDM